MKKKLYILVIFITLGANAQNFNKFVYINEVAFNDASRLANLKLAEKVSVNTSKVLVSIYTDVKKEIVKIRSTHLVEELSINNLQGKKLVHNKNQNFISLTNLTRGVYILKAKIGGVIFSKKIILQ